MTWQRFPPAYSPLTLGALAGGAAASLLGQPGALAREIQRRYQSVQVALCDSGTSALTLALGLACRDIDAPLVALPAYGCYDLATAALGIRAEVILYDLDPETLAPESRSLVRTLEARPDAVVTAYLYGIPFDTQALRRQVAEAGAVLVEDAAQAFGASIRGTPCGALGPIGVLSFGRGKGVTGGGGGALLVRDPELHGVDRLAARSGWSGWTKALVQWAFARPAWYWLPAGLPFLRLGDTVYHPPQAPYEMPGINQAVLLRLLDAADQEAEVRREHGSRLARLLADSSRVALIRPRVGDSGYLRFPVLSANPALRSGAARRLGVMPGYPQQLADLPALRDRVTRSDAQFPGARRLIEELVTLPTHSLLGNRDLDRLGSLAG